MTGMDGLRKAGCTGAEFAEAIKRNARVVGDVLEMRILNPEVSGMDDLATWLRTQLDDDERTALTFEVSTGMWLCHHCGGAMDSAVRLDAHLFEHGHREWGPARMLAEVDAKRRILDLRDDEVADIGHEDYEISTTAATSAGALDDVIKLLALLYADQLGYREEWRP